MGQDLVDRATSDTLIAPDWVLNGEICNDINQDARLVKDVVKALKKRLGHKNPKVQILALSLLESMIKECGEVVHAFVAEREVPKEMVKIAKKKPDPRVKQKILLLIEAWQEVFGGPLGMYPQYYAAYQELLHSGFVFPEKIEASTALVVHPLYQQTLPSQNHPTSEDAEHREKEHSPPARSKDISRLMSISDFKDARDVVDVLSEMLNDLGSGNKEGLSQEVIVNLVCECRTNKERVVRLLNATTDEYIISKASALNDDLEKILARYKAILAEEVVAEKSSITPKQENDSVEQETSNEANSDNRSVPSTSEGDKLPPQQSELPDRSSESNATPSTPAKVEEPLIDLLSGDDFFQLRPDENALAIVVYEPNRTDSNQQVSSLTDMFADLLSDNPIENPGIYSNSQLPTTLPSVQSTVQINRNLPDQHLPETMPGHVMPNAPGNRNLPDQHSSESISWNVQPTVPANINSPDQHLLGTMPLHVDPIVHVNGSSQYQVQPESISWLGPTFYSNGGHFNSEASTHREEFQMNNASNQSNQISGTSNHNESLPPPPWEFEASDINPFQDNQTAIKTTYPTQQPQSYPTQQHQLMQQPQPYPTQQPQQYLNQQPQSYPTQQPQPYLTQQPQPYLNQWPQPYLTQQSQQYPTEQPRQHVTQEPQQKQVKESGFLSTMSRHIAITQNRSLPPKETPTNLSYSQTQNVSGTNQQVMYSSQIGPYYNQNMYTYGYGNSYGALNQEGHSLYNTQMPTPMVQQPNNFQNFWNGGTF